MDDDLQKLVDIASEHSGSYIKGKTGIHGLAEHTAELGAYLLAACRRIDTCPPERVKEELNDIQFKVDDFRKAIFVIKYEITTRHSS